MAEDLKLKLSTEHVVGADDYNLMFNKPKINGVEVSGEKSLDDFDIKSKSEANAEHTEINAAISAETKRAQTAEKVNADAIAKVVSGTAATITIGTVTTGDAGTSASVTNSGTASAAVFDFVIPKGDKGDTGADGATGATGADGKTPAITATASVDDTTGTPAVKVTKSGTEVAPNFDFAFSGVKGTGGSSQVHETVAVTTTGWEDSTVNSTTYKKWTGVLSKTYKPELTMCRLLPAGIVPTSDELTAYGLLVSATIDGTNLYLYGKAVPSVTYTVLISGVVK